MDLWMLGCSHIKQVKKNWTQVEADRIVSMVARPAYQQLKFLRIYIHFFNMDFFIDIKIATIIDKDWFVKDFELVFVSCNLTWLGLFGGGDSHRSSGAKVAGIWINSLSPNTNEEIQHSKVLPTVQLQSENLGGSIKNLTDQPKRWSFSTSTLQFWINEQLFEWF